MHYVEGESLYPLSVSSSRLIPPLSDYLLAVFSGEGDYLGLSCEVEYVPHGWDAGGYGRVRFPRDTINVNNRPNFPGFHLV